MTWNHPRFSPRDLRVSIRLLAGMLVWKTLSADFTNLVDLMQEPRPIFWVSMHLDAVTRFLNTFGEQVLNSARNIQAAQLLVAGSLAAAAVWMNRWALLAATAMMWLFWGHTLLYTANVFESEVYLFFLFLFTLWPARWASIVGSSRVVSPAATALGCTCIFAIGVWYFFAGWAKIRIDPTWILNARLEFLYPSILLWRGDDPASWLPTAAWLNDLWTAFPKLGIASAAIVLVAELAFPLALVSRWMRWFVVGSMLAFHLCFFLSGGAFFLPNMVVLIFFSVPWRKLGRMDPTLAASPEEPWTMRERGRMFLMMGVVLAAHSACVVHHRNYAPVMNWCVFSWGYPSFDKPVETFRIGYRDREDGEVYPMPHNCGAFLGYRYTHALTQAARQLAKETDPQLREQALAKLRVLLAARREHGSNRWLLGSLALPDHAVVRSNPPRTGENPEYFLMVGESSYENRQFETRWLRVEPLPR